MDSLPLLAFIGGGNMASAILGGLRRGGTPAEAFIVVEPYGSQRERLRAELGIAAQPGVDSSLARAALVVWAVKPQLFPAAAAPCAVYVREKLHLSVMAGIQSETIVAACGSPRVVRVMPNTPALIGRGVAGVFARSSVTLQDRELVQAVLRPTGSLEWVAQERDLDAVTALSGSGPAYVFYVLEALVQAGADMGLDPSLARRLAQETFAGAAAMAMQSGQTPEELRLHVTSKGGTTHAAISVLEARGVKSTFVRALHAARDRAEQLGRS